MREKQSGPVALFIAGALFLVVGGAVAYFFGWPAIVEARASRSWSSTPGKITVSRVESRRNRDSTMYAHHVEYTFAVEGVPHTGSRVWVNDGWSSGSSVGAKRTVSQYPVGCTTTVYYDPDAPEVCVLQNGSTWMTYAVFGFGSLFCLIGTLLGWFVAL